MATARSQTVLTVVTLAYGGGFSQGQGFNALISDQDMADSFLPAFRACITEAKGASVMCSYNAVSKPTTASVHLSGSPLLQVSSGAGAEPVEVLGGQSQNLCPWVGRHRQGSFGA